MRKSFLSALTALISATSMIITVNAFGNEDVFTPKYYNNTQWMIATMPDKFQRPTDDLFIFIAAEDGNFNGPSAQNSPLVAQLNTAKENEQTTLCLVLIEYGNMLVSDLFMDGKNDNLYDVYVLDSNEEEHHFYGIMDEQNSGIYLTYDLNTPDYKHNSDAIRDMIEILENEGLVYFNLQEINGRKKYNFDIDVSGFNNLVKDYPEHFEDLCK